MAVIKTQNGMFQAKVKTTAGYILSKSYKTKAWAQKVSKQIRERELKKKALNKEMHKAIGNRDGHVHGFAWKDGLLAGGFRTSPLGLSELYKAGFRINLD